MRIRCQILWLCAGLGAGAVLPLPAQDWLEASGEHLQFHSANGNLRARVGVLLELEAQHRDDPVAEIPAGDEAWLFAPRLTLNLDLQAGESTYLFVQARADRGFDAYDQPLEVRLDEYAVRFALLPHGRLNLQAGKFATVVGNWVARHDTRRNPFITAPLPYENLTSIWDLKPPPTAAKLLEWAHVKPLTPGSSVLLDKAFRLPVIWGPAYAHGIALSGAWGKFTGAVELKTAGISSRPADWRHASLGERKPALGARLGWRPNEMWDLGLSYSEGEYLNHGATALVPAGFSRHDYQQRVWAQDVSFAWHRFQFWAEAFATEFAVPHFAKLHTFAYYLEAKYKFSATFSTAVRWNQQTFGDLPVGGGVSLPWSRETWRIDVAPTWRLGSHSQLKLQGSLRHERPAVEEVTTAWAVQYSFWF